MDEAGTKNMKKRRSRNTADFARGHLPSPLRLNLRGPSFPRVLGALFLRFFRLHPKAQGHAVLIDRRKRRRIECRLGLGGDLLEGFQFGLGEDQAAGLGRALGGAGFDLTG